MGLKNRWGVHIGPSDSARLHRDFCVPACLTRTAGYARYNRRCFLGYSGVFGDFGLCVQTSSRTQRLDFLSKASFMDKSDNFRLPRSISESLSVKSRWRSPAFENHRVHASPQNFGISEKTAPIIMGLTLPFVEIRNR